MPLAKRNNHKSPNEALSVQIPAYIAADEQVDTVNDAPNTMQSPESAASPNVSAGCTVQVSQHGRITVKVAKYSLISVLSALVCALVYYISTR